MELTDRDIERFWAKVDRGGGEHACWPWLGAKRDGYGTMKLNGKTVLAHRVSFLVATGSLPEDGRIVAHLPIVCHNRACQNPNHLRSATPSENEMDKRLDVSAAGPCEDNANKTNCVHGHPLDGDNLYLRPSGGRRCRECNRRSFREWYGRRRKQSGMR